MNSKELFNLTQDLIEMMEIAKVEASTIKIEENVDGYHFVHCGEQEYINPKYISFLEQRQITQLGKFIRMYPTLTEEDLAVLLTDNRSRYPVIYDVMCTIPNLIEEAKSHNEDKHLPYIYLGFKRAREKENGINV